MMPIMSPSFWRGGLEQPADEEDAEGGGERTHDGAHDHEGDDAHEQAARGEPVVEDVRDRNEDRRDQEVAGRQPLDRPHVHAEVRHDRGEGDVEERLVEGGEEGGCCGHRDHGAHTTGGLRAGVGGLGHGVLLTGGG
jgi:hypothetical protein